MLLIPPPLTIRRSLLTDVDIFRHHCNCQRRFAPTLFASRRNGPFTSPEYAFDDSALLLRLLTETAGISSEHQCRSYHSS